MVALCLGLEVAWVAGEVQSAARALLLKWIISVTGLRN